METKANRRDRGGALFCGMLTSQGLICDRKLRLGHTEIERRGRRARLPPPLLPILLRTGPHLARRLVGHAVRLPRVFGHGHAQGRLEARRRRGARVGQKRGRVLRGSRSRSGHRRRARRDQEGRLRARGSPLACCPQARDEHGGYSCHTRPRNDDVQKRRPRGLVLHIFTQFHLLLDGRGERRGGFTG